MRIYLSQSGDSFIVPIDSSRGLLGFMPATLVSGSVKDVSRGLVVARIWVDDFKVYVLYQISHNEAWPHDVYIFDRQSLIDAKEAHQQQIIPVHEFLAKGYGIPPAPTG